MITVADPQILWNDGFYPLVDVTIPDGSYWKPKLPGRAQRPQPRHRPGLRPVRRAARADQPGAAQRGRLLLLAALHVLRASTRTASGRGSGSSCTRSASAASPAGRSATGRTATRCGRRSSNIPCEYLESYYPLRIEKWETVADTGGAGLHRGGNGVDVAYVFEEPGTIAIHDDRWLTYPWGVNGGHPGARGTKWVERADGTRQVLPSKCHDVPVSPGDVLHFVTWGGGGWGDPLERDPELVAQEVRRGLVTAEGAKRYGVCVADDGTRRRRGDRDAARPDARRPAGRPAGLRHGAADRGAAGQLRGGDRAAGAQAPGLGRVSGPHGAAFSGRVGWGTRPAVARRRPGARLHRPGRPVRAARPGAGGGGDRASWSAAARARRAPGGLDRRPVRARPRRRRAVRAQGAGAGLLRRGRARRLGRRWRWRRSRGSRCVVKQYASAFFGTSLASTLHAAGRGHPRGRRGVDVGLRAGHRRWTRSTAASGRRWCARRAPTGRRRCTRTTWPTSTPSTPTSSTWPRRSRHL